VLVPDVWVTAARAHLAAAQAAGVSTAQLSSISPDDLLLTRELLCAGLGWQRPGGGADSVIRLTDQLLLPRSFNVSQRLMP
jgi:hypothetical protein